MGNKVYGLNVPQLKLINGTGGPRSSVNMILIALVNVILSFYPIRLNLLVEILYCCRWEYIYLAIYDLK